MATRRINIMGGPGCGKSTAAASIFSRLKAEGHAIELVDEYVKAWAYEKKEIGLFDQPYLFMQQLRKEYLILKNSNSCVVTDSPIVMAICYARKYGFRQWESLQTIADDFEREYPSVNIILKREGCEYKQEGRYEDYDQALYMDDMISNYIIGLDIEYCKMPFNDHDRIVEWVKRTINPGK